MLFSNKHTTNTSTDIFPAKKGLTTQRLNNKTAFANQYLGSGLTNQPQQKVKGHYMCPNRQKTSTTVMAEPKSDSHGNLQMRRSTRNLFTQAYANPADFQMRDKEGQQASKVCYSKNCHGAWQENNQLMATSRTQNLTDFVENTPRSHVVKYGMIDNLTQNNTQAFQNI